ncbi:MAG: hypothetical protein LBI64_03635 [Coriobacteriales bacterium]|nr:hypothetical protein [Coriobacteriales bacterium]
MKIRPGTVVMACVVVALLATGIAFGFYLKQERIASYTGPLAFFYENRELFEDIRSELPILDGYVDETGYFVWFDEQRNATWEWYPKLAEDALHYFEIVPYPQPNIGSSGVVSGCIQIDFEFYYRDTRVMEGFMWTNGELPEDLFTRVEGNWYYYRIGMV